MHEQVKIKIEGQGDGGFAGAFSIKKHKKGDIKWHRDEHGGVVVDMDSFKAALDKPLYTHPTVHNKIVSGAGGYGRNLVMRQLCNDTTYSIAIDSAKIGSGTNTPADSDTDLQTAVLSGIVVRLYELTNDSAVISFFIPDEDLANGTYTEFGLFINGRLFARALISPTYGKSTNEDTSIEYTVSLSATS